MKKEAQADPHADPLSTGTDNLQMNVPRYRVLLAEDDDEMRALLAMTLSKSGYDVVECADGIGMLTHLAAFLLPDEFDREPVDLIISDIRMPGVTGMEILEGKPSRRDFPPMILITAFGDAQTHALAKQYGAAAILDKPFDMDLLLEKVRHVLEKGRTRTDG